MPIKNIILDLGGVLLNIDYQRTASAFENLGFAQFNQMYSQYAADQLFEKLETGAISPANFYTSLQQIKNVSVGQINHAWNAMLLDFRKNSFNYLETLANEYKLFLLSNTNAIHKAAFDHIFQTENTRPMDTYFLKPYYSHLIGKRKPNDDIYEFVLDDAGIKPEETLFIDDSYNNIDAAQKLGIQTHLLQKGSLIEGVIPNYLTSS